MDALSSGDVWRVRAHAIKALASYRRKRVHVAAAYASRWPGVPEAVFITGALERCVVITVLGPHTETVWQWCIRFIVLVLTDGLSLGPVTCCSCDLLWFIVVRYTNLLCTSSSVCIRTFLASLYPHFYVDVCHYSIFTSIERGQRLLLKVQSLSSTLTGNVRFSFPVFI